MWEKWICGAGGAIVDDGIAMERGKRRMEDEKGMGGWGGGSRAKCCLSHVGSQYRILPLGLTLSEICGCRSVSSFRF